MLGNGPNKVQGPFSSTWPRQCRQLSWGVHHMPCQLQRDKEDSLMLTRQHLPAAASVHHSEPRLAQGTFIHFIRHKEPFQQRLLDSSHPKKKTPKLSRTEATCFQVSIGPRPGARRSRPRPQVTLAGRLQPREAQFPSDSKVPPRQALVPLPVSAGGSCTGRPRGLHEKLGQKS